MFTRKKILVLLVSLTLFISAHAQLKMNGWYYIPLPMNDSAEWCVVYQDGRNAQPKWHFYRYYKTKGDTFISGHTYKKVWTNTLHHKYLPTDTLVCMYRQDTAARKVFVRSAYTYYPDTNEYLEMDFGVKDKDTLYLPVFTRSGVYEKRKFFVLGLDSQKVVSGSFPPKTTYDRTLYQTRCTDTSNLVYGDMIFPLSDYTFQEGIGSDGSTGPFFYPIARKRYIDETDVTSRIVDTVAYLHCLEYKDSVLWLYQSHPLNFSCSDILSVIPVKSLQTIRFFPNPCMEYIDIELGNTSLNPKVEIIDIDGKKIETSINVVGSGTERIDTSNLPRGIYILNIFNKQGLNESYKLIKL